MDLKRLRFFLAVADELHFHRAAERLGVSQPPLSVAIKALEEELGCVLFNRNRRKVSLTPAGERLQEEARQVFNLVDHAVAVTRQVAGSGDGGRLRLGLAATSFLRQPLLEPVRRYRASNPDVSLQFFEVHSPDSIDALERGIVDVAFMRHSMDLVPNLNSRHIMRERLVLALSASHPLAQREKVDLAQLANEAILFGTRSTVKDTVAQCCRRSGFEPNIVTVELPQIYTLLGLVAMEIGVTFVPETMVNCFGDMVVFRPIINDHIPASHFLLVYKRSSDLIKEFESYFTSQSGRVSEVC